MQYLYTFKTRYGVVHADLGPVFMLSSMHLEMLWSELTATCRAEGCRRAIVERSGRFRDLRANELGGQGDLLCGLEGADLRVAFCLYGLEGDDFFDSFVTFATAAGCRVRRFEQLDRALGWVGEAFAEDLALARQRADAQTAAAAASSSAPDSAAAHTARVA